MFPRMVSRLPLIPLAVTVLVAGCDGRAPLGPEFLARTTAATSVSSTSAAALSESEIDVSWQDNSTNEAGFEVHRSTTGASGTFTLRATTGAGVTAFGDGGLSPSTEYCYKVRMFRTTGRKTSYSTFYNAACATTLAPPVPTAPSGTDATPIGSSAVGMQWVDTSADEDGFRVERSLDMGSTWATVGTVGPNVTSSFDVGLASEQPVCYRVVAFILIDSFGPSDSPPSGTDCTTPPAAPSALTATGVDETTIALAWTDNSTVEDGYQVVRITSTTWIPIDLPPNSTGYRDTGVSTDTTYWYVVQAKMDGGFSDDPGPVSPEGWCLPTSDEICDNGVGEDDCDGLTDGDDPECSFDCGMGCPVGYVCGYDGFCVPHCNDGVQNGNEGDVDCGGDCDAKCAAGQTCWVNADCASGICGYGICQAVPGGQP